MFLSGTFIPVIITFCTELNYCNSFVNGTSFIYCKFSMVILRNTDIVVISGTGAINKTAQEVSVPENTRKKEKPSAI